MVANDENTARRSFLYYKVSANITGVDKKLITNCSIILRVISSGKDKPNGLIKETGDLNVKLYGLYNSSVHKWFFYSIDVIDSSDEPKDQLSEEETLESMHTVFCIHKLQKTRKSLREKTSGDLKLLLFDPLIEFKL